jgi:hypothetical protein
MTVPGLRKGGSCGYRTPSELTSPKPEGISGVLSAWERRECAMAILAMLEHGQDARGTFAKANAKMKVHPGMLVKIKERKKRRCRVSGIRCQVTKKQVGRVPRTPYNGITRESVENKRGRNGDLTDLQGKAWGLDGSGHADSPSGAPIAGQFDVEAAEFIPILSGRRHLAR